MKRYWLGVVVGCALGVSPLFAADGTGLQISGTGDIIGMFGTSNSTPNTNRFDAREAELTVFAPIDHLFDGQISLAAHQENGAAFFEIHELFVGSTKLIPRSRFRVGQYFLGFGRLNQFHRHDWPFISAPKVNSVFFGGSESIFFEAARDTGVEYSWLMPLPFYLDLTVGITNGWVLGHSHVIGTKPNMPTHYIRAATFVDPFLGEGKMQLGFNYVGRRDSGANNRAFFGIDATAKWREQDYTKFLLQSEIWLMLHRPNGGTNENILGYYLFPQYSFNSNWSVGIRFDGYWNLTRTDAFGNSARSFSYGVVPTVSYKASEFSTFRVAYNWKGTLEDGTERLPERLLEFQAVFILGAHPAHEF
jgi:hypothetical protein